jgi:hypothetical protein
LQARELGSWMLEEDAQNADGSSHVRLTEIMRLTAATVA